MKAICSSEALSELHWSTHFASQKILNFMISPSFVLYSYEIWSFVLKPNRIEDAETGETRKIFRLKRKEVVATYYGDSLLVLFPNILMVTTLRIKLIGICRTHQRINAYRSFVGKLESNAMRC
jgi:hypothetical protein